MAARARICSAHDSSVSGDPQAFAGPVQVLTRLGSLQAITSSVQIYARRLEDVFIDELYPQEEEKQEESWFERARLAVQGGKQLVPFAFDTKVNQ